METEIKIIYDILFLSGLHAKLAFVPGLRIGLYREVPGSWYTFKVLRKVQGRSNRPKAGFCIISSVFGQKI